MSENVDCLQKYRKMTFADDDACLPPALFSQPFNAVLNKNFRNDLNRQITATKKVATKTSQP